MHSADDRSPKPVLTCSLCGKSQHDVSDLTGGPEVFVREFICDKCVRLELAKPKNPMADHAGPQASFDTSTGSSRFEVRLLNDDYTPMEFVVYVLKEVFELEHEDAVRIMLQTHHGGGGCMRDLSPRDGAGQGCAGNGPRPSTSTSASMLLPGTECVILRSFSFGPQKLIDWVIFCPTLRVSAAARLVDHRQRGIVPPVGEK